MAKSTAPKYSHLEIIDELNYEIRMRKEVYANKVASGSMTQATMDKKISLLAEAIRIIQSTRPPQSVQGSLF